MNDAVILERRETGKIPVSIPTSLAIEGLFGILETPEGVPKSTDPVPAYEVDEVWINLRTLFRNMQGSVEAEGATQVNGHSYGLALMEEMTILKETIDQLSIGKIKTFFYVCSHMSLRRDFPNARLKEPRTDRQLFYAALEKEAIETVLKNKTEQEVTVYDVSVQMHVKRCAMLTNFPVDLVMAKNFGTLVLLESHTGAVKKNHQWNTKLQSGKELSRIPFNKMSLQVFGDTCGVFAPFQKPYRDVILKIAEQYRWNAFTTKDRIIQSVKLANEPALLATIRPLF